jgi:homoserine kinase
VRRLRIEVPGTTANLGPGFDTIGMALDLADTVHVELDAGSDEIVLCEAAPEAGPLDPHHNLFCDSYRRWGEEAGIRLPGARFRAESRIPIARGLGSSAACIVAGLVAAAHATDAVARPSVAAQLSAAADSHGRDRVMNLASLIEGHPDNAVAAVLGGITVGFLDGPTAHAIQIAAEPPLGVALFIPDRALLTAEARASLPREVPLADAIFNLGRAAFLSAAFATERWDALRPAMADRLHQPYRLHHVPELDDIIAAACEAGAYGAALSGGGPSVIALTPPDAAGHVAGAMERAGHASRCDGRGITTRIRPHGYTVQELE